MAETVYGFSEEGFRRVRDAVRSSRGTSVRGSQRRRQPPVLSSGSGTTTVIGQGCGGCGTPSGNLVVDLGGGLVCSDRYTFSPMCNDLLPITFVYDTGSDWDGGPDTLSVSCDDDGEVTITATLTISGQAAGDVTITLSDGTNTWTWENDTAFVPDEPVAMRRMTGPVDCPCSTWRPYPCLSPLNAA